MTQDIITLGEDYGYRSKSAPPLTDDAGEEYVPEEAMDELPIVKLDDWLSPDAERPTKWVELPGRSSRILIQAMTQKEFKEIRRKAPMIRSGKGEKSKIVKNEDWIQNQVILANVIEPKIPKASYLENALAGDVAFLVMQITKLSGFDVESVMRDALEL
jgi:hypothetical protein